MTILFWALLLAFFPVIFSCLYLGLMTLLSGPLPQTVQGATRVRFVVVVPAHDEAAGIGRTVDSLFALDWPREQLRILVVADNCTDQTAAIARRHGAEVLERTDTVKRGKGYALEYAFGSDLVARDVDAFVVVDADTIVSGNLLRAFASRLERGERALQAHYGVLNPSETWRTRLATIAFSCFHRVRSRARERLGLSCGLRGNGWCVTTALLRAQPFKSYSLAEDVEFGIDLALGSATRVCYVDEASVRGEMVTSAAAAQRQRQRWEGGRILLVRSRVPPLLAAALRRPSAVCLDLALDLLVPPLSYVILGVMLMLGVFGVGAAFGVAVGAGLPIAVVSLLCVILYVLRGWQISGVGLEAIRDFLHVPGFIVWKVLAMVRSRIPVEWIRTERNEGPP